MNIIFAGTPDFAKEALQSLINAGHTISLVLTKPDAVSGRGMSLRPSPVKVLAEQYGITVAQPKTLKDHETKEMLRSVNADLMVVAAYGIILPEDVLNIPTLGCLNIHGSLLPRWRGAAPIHRAILAGDKETGITIIQMDAGLDTGKMLSSYPLAIENTDTTGTLHDKMAKLGAKAIVETIDNLKQINATPQPEYGMTYAAKVTKEEAHLNFNSDGEQLALAVRAYNPFPGAVGQLDWMTLKIWEADFIPTHEYDHVLPGVIVEANSLEFLVRVANGVLSLKTIQLAGGKKMKFDAFLSGHSDLLGKVFS